MPVPLARSASLVSSSASDPADDGPKRGSAALNDGKISKITVSLGKKWWRMVQEDGIAETVGRMQVYFDTIGIISALTLGVSFTALTAPPERPRSPTAKLSAVLGCVSICAYMLAIIIGILVNGFLRTRIHTTKQEHADKFLNVIVEYQHFYPLPERLFTLGCLCMVAQLIVYCHLVYGRAVSIFLMGAFGLVVTFTSWVYCCTGNRSSVRDDPGSGSADVEVAAST